MLPKDPRLFLRVSHQGTDPHRLVRVLLDQRVDVLRHLLGRCAGLGHVFLVGLEDPRHFTEVVSVLPNHLGQSGE